MAEKDTTLRELVRDIHTKVNRMEINIAEQTIYGKDKEKRLLKIEKYIDADKGLKQKAAGIFVVLSALWVLFLDIIKDFIKKMN